MKIVLRVIAICVSSIAGSFYYTAVSAADTAVCSYTMPNRISWADSLARQLHNHDPSHATQMSKVASEIINGRSDVLQTEIKAGLDPNATLKLGSTPINDMSLLTLAVAACQEGVAQQLISSGASVNGPGAPLVVAAGKGDVALTDLLIGQGAKIDQVDENGHTALEDAVRQRQLGTVKLLLSKNANPNPVVSDPNATLLDFVKSSSDATDQAIADTLRHYGTKTTTRAQ